MGLTDEARSPPFMSHHYGLYLEFLVLRAPHHNICGSRRQKWQELLGQTGQTVMKTLFI